MTSPTPDAAKVTPLTASEYAYLKTQFQGRWLDEVVSVCEHLFPVREAKAAAKAWDEGHHAGVKNATADYDEYGSIIEPAPFIDNPYRALADELDPPDRRTT